MRIALLSDIHGNLVALDAVLEDLSHAGPVDRIVVAGDLVWSGPWPRQVVDRLREIGATAIQGNTDAFFAHSPDDAPDDKHADRFTAQLAWMQAQLGPERTAYLAELPFALRISPPEAPAGADLLIVHANPSDQNRAILPHMPEAELDALLTDGPTAPDWAALAFGHIHVPYQRPWRERLLVDVASVGLPMDGDPRAAYAILAWDGAAWSAAHRRVFYPVPEATYEMRISGMPRAKHFAERLMSAGYQRGIGAPALSME